MTPETMQTMRTVLEKLSSFSPPMIVTHFHKEFHSLGEKSHFQAHYTPPSYMNHRYLRLLSSPSDSTLLCGSDPGSVTSKGEYILFYFNICTIQEEIGRMLNITQFQVNEHLQVTAAIFTVILLHMAKKRQCQSQNIAGVLKKTCLLLLACKQRL